MSSEQVAAQYRAAARFDAGEVDEATGEMRRLAAEGVSSAQVFLGWAAELGQSRPVDLEEAAAWYTAAAEAGDPLGQLYLGGLLLRRGETSAGAQWIRQAAAQGYPPALYRLGRLYASGTGLERDESECLRCMKGAAAKGHLFAQRWLAGRGVRGADGVRGFVRACLWFLSMPILAIRHGWNRPEDPNMIQG